MNSLVESIKQWFIECGTNQLNQIHSNESIASSFYHLVFFFLVLILVEHILFISDIKQKDPIVTNNETLGITVMLFASAFLFFSFSVVIGYSMSIFQENIIKAMIFVASYILITLSIETPTSELISPPQISPILYF